MECNDKYLSCSDGALGLVVFPPHLVRRGMYTEAMLSSDMLTVSWTYKSLPAGPSLPAAGDSVSLARARALSCALSFSLALSRAHACSCVLSCTLTRARTRTGSDGERDTVIDAEDSASGAARASRGVVRVGKVYWEVEVGGQCAVVGVVLGADSNVDAYPGVDRFSFGFGDSGHGGELHHDEASAFGQAISEPTVVSVAVHVDGSSFKIWFGKDGKWMEGGQPGSDLAPAAFVSSFSQRVFPAVGLVPGESVRGCARVSLDW